MTTTKEPAMDCDHDTTRVDNPGDLPVICGTCGEAIYLPEKKKASTK